MPRWHKVQACGGGHRRALSGGDVAAIVQRIRAEIATVSAQEAWSNSWSGEGEIPDYSRVESGLESLVDVAHHDTVVELGQELFEAGQDQIGRSHSASSIGSGASAPGPPCQMPWRSGLTRAALQWGLTSTVATIGTA